MKESFKELTRQELRTIKGGDATSTPPPPSEPSATTQSTSIQIVDDIDKKDVKPPGGN